MARILLVDDHPLFADGFAQMARALRPAWTLFFANEAHQALGILTTMQLDLVIVDANLPGIDGFALLRMMKQSARDMPQILISGRDDAAMRMRAEAIGVRTFITKTAKPDDIAAVIDEVLRGDRVSPAGASCRLPALTPRQIEVLMLLAEGLGNKEIRHRLDIAERTVRAHLTELFQVLGASSRTQALVKAREFGLIA